MTMEDVEWKNPLLRAWAGLLKGWIWTVKGAYEWIVPWFWELIEDSKRIIADPNKSAPEKFNQILFWEIGADYLGGIIGDTFGGALEWLYEWFTSESERKYISEKTKWVMDSITKIEPVQNIMKKYNQLNPNEQQELNDLLGYAMNATNFLWLEAGLSKPVQWALKEWGEMLVKWLDTTAGKVLGKLDNVKIGKQATIEDANSIVWKIIQWETSDIAPALEALKNIDTKWVASYKDLSEILEARGKNYMELVDENLLKDTRKLKPKDTTVTTTVWNTTVTQTPIVKGITQLEELYSSIDDPTNLARIKELNTKFKNEWLSLKELNDVAREYNSVFKAKAFSKLWDPLTSVNAQAYENNRKAMKEFVRSQLPDDTTKLLDKQYSNIASTKQLVDKMVEKVNSLSQKINKRWTIENIARGIGRAVDIASFGWVRWLLTSFLPSNIGNKVLNSIDLEDALKSSLKKLDTIVKKIDNWTITESDIKFLTHKTPNGTSTTNSSNASIQQSKVLNKPNDISVRKPTVMMKGEDPLIQEAKKYKSAEEFVNAKATNLHWTKANFEEFSSDKLWTNTNAKSAKEWFFFTDNIENANHYTKSSFNWDEIIAKILKMDELKFDSSMLSKRFWYSNPIDAISMGEWWITKERILKQVSDTFDKDVLDTQKTIKEYFPKYQQEEYLTKLNKIESNKQKVLDIWNKEFDNIKWTANPNIKKTYLDYKKPYNMVEEKWYKWVEYTKVKWADGKTFKSYTDAIKYAKENWYDAVTIKWAIDPLPWNTTIVFDTKQIKTESQLKQIREEANKK